MAEQFGAEKCEFEGCTMHDWLLRPCDCGRRFCKQHATPSSHRADDTLTSPETAAPGRHLVSTSRSSVGVIDSLASKQPSELIDAIKTRFDDSESTTGPSRYNVQGSRSTAAEQNRVILQQTRGVAAVEAVKKSVAKSKNPQQKRIDLKVIISSPEGATYALIREEDRIYLEIQCETGPPMNHHQGGGPYYFFFRRTDCVGRALDFLFNRLKVPQHDGEGAMELVRQRTGNILPLTAPLGNGAGDGVGLEDCEVVFLARKGTEISSVQNRGEDSRQQLVGVSSQETQHVSHVVQPDSWPSALDAESFVERESLKHKIPRQLDDVQEGTDAVDGIIRCNGLEPEEGLGLCFFVTLGKSSSSTKEKTWKVVGVNPASTIVHVLKNHLERETQIPSARIKLMYKGILNDDMKFCETKVKQECKVLLMGS